MSAGSPFVFPITPVGTATFIVRESPGYYSRDEITVASGQGKLRGGTIVSKSGTTYVSWATTMTNAAILYADVDATSSAVKATVLIRDVEVQKAMLTFTGTPTAPQKTEAYGVLAAAGIIMR